MTTTGLGCSLLSIPKVTNVNPIPATNDYISTISWDAPCGEVEFYTLYYGDGSGACQHKMLGAEIKSYMVENLSEMQIATHRNNTAKCSPGMYSGNEPLVLYPTTMPFP